MAESMLLAVVRGVAGKAADQLVQTVTRMCGLDGDRETLELHLLAVQRKLASAEERSGTDHAVKRWMKKLKDIVNEADDVLDDFQYEALRRKAQIGESTPRRLIGYFTHHNPVRFRYAMSGKLKTVLSKINKLVEDMNKFGLENSVHLEGPQQPPPMWQTHSKLDEFSEIFGRDDEKKGIVKLLLDQQDQRKVQVLPIFGMGGLGKTTTAKMVYNDKNIQQHFQLKMWHCVSDNFDVIPLLKSIIQLATNGSYQNPPDNIEPLRQKLEEAIGCKRFLLVLDDVWNEQRTLWEDDLKPLLCSVGEPGSAILVTCRSKQVASLMSTVTPHMLNFLSGEDSWKLFSLKAFGNGVQEQADLVTMGRRIVSKCGGLPLALKAMGGLLSSNQQVQDWKAIEETNIGDNIGGKNGVVSILKLSYKHLSSEMKQCFAICALFSKDYEMQKDMLIQLWMANGFIQEEKTMDLTQKGEAIFHDLVHRSFLQDMKVVVNNVFYGRRFMQYETTVCKMHDLARDVSDDCATIEELIEQKVSVEDVCHLQMSAKVKLEKINGVFQGKNSSIRTLLAPSMIHKDFNRLPQKSLRALHWQSKSGIPFKAVNSKKLRYLDLSGCVIKDSLLDSICLLYNLQTLSLIGCSSELRQLPDDMVIGLRKLIHLYLLGCEWMEKMPRNIGQLNNLRTLTTFVVDTISGCGIEELRDLRHLRNRLELYSLRKIKSVNKAKEANLQQKQDLSELLFSWGRSIDDEPENEACNEQQVFQCLEPHSKIQILELYGYGGPEMPQWMGDPQMFQYLRKLKISNCTRCKNIPLVWLSSSLVYLSLVNMGKLKTLCDNNLAIEGGSRQIFPKLKMMKLVKLASLERWVENSAGEAVDSFPVLEDLLMRDCPVLCSFPLSPTLKVLKVTSCCTIATSSFMQGGIPRLPASLEVLWIHHCKSWVALPPNLGDLAKLRDLQVRACSGLKRLADGMNDLISPRELDIRGCPALEEFHNGLLQWLPALEDLTITFCPKLKTLCGNGGSRQIFPKLKKLNLESMASLERWVENSTGEAIDSFPVLEVVQMVDCPMLRSFPMGPTLRVMMVERCCTIATSSNVEGNASSSEEQPQFDIPRLPASLEKLRIYNCESWVALPPNLGDLAKLRVLSVSTCSGLKALPDGMDGLTSLQELTIRGCPEIEEFPNGLLQRLPALKCLTLHDCPELQRRCREGGEYFDLVSSIPTKFGIAATEAESRGNRFLTSLVPCCAHPKSDNN